MLCGHHKSSRSLLDAADLASLAGRLRGTVFRQVNAISEWTRAGQYGLSGLGELSDEV